MDSQSPKTPSPELSRTSAEAEIAPDIRPVQVELGSIAMLGINVAELPSDVREALLRQDAIIQGLKKELQEQIQKQTELEALIVRDELTGCYNRRAFTEFVEKFNPMGRHSQVALVYVDMNGLSQINNTLGHDVGDEKLRSLVDFLNANFRTKEEEDKIYRLGGDEFVIVCRNYDNKLNANTAPEETSFFEGLKAKIEQIKTAQNVPSASYGLVEFDPAVDNNDIVKTLHRGDQIMYDEKIAHYNKLGIDVSHKYKKQIGQPISI